jgi:hypothetical protein
MKAKYTRSKRLNDLMDRFLKAQAEMRRVKAEYNDARDTLRDTIKRDYGRNLKVVFVLQRMTAWVYEKAGGRGYFSRRGCEVLKVRPPIKSEMAGIEKELAKPAWGTKGRRDS